MSARRRFSALLAAGSVVAAGAWTALPSAAAAEPTVAGDWSTLAAAFAAGEDVELGVDLTAPAGADLAVPASGSVGLDLQGHDLTITDVADDHAAIGVPASATLTITDTAPGEDNKLTATGGQVAAGIGGGGGDDGGTVVVNGAATIKATGGHGGAGIGGGYGGDGGTFTANDTSTINATGGYEGAGIGGGGGYGGNGGTFTANDTSTIKATGGTLGAAIGGGKEGAGGSITIAIGASVTATGAPRAVGAGVAGWGSADSLSNAGTLTVAGGPEAFYLYSTFTITNTGTIINNGRIAGHGVLVNTGTITGTGTVADNGQAAAGTGLRITTNSYVLSYDENRDDPDTHPNTVVLAPTVTAAGKTLPTPNSPADTTFTGWYTAASGGTRITHDTDLNSILGDGPAALTLYAHYVDDVVDTWAELVAAFDADVENIRLTTDLTAPADAYLAVPGSGSVGLDLRGHNLTITDVAVGHAAIGVPASATLTVTDTAPGDDNTLTATGGIRGAGIGGGNNATAGTIFVAGGSTLIATGGLRAAGIGGGSDGNGGTLTTNDTSTITANGGFNGAGVGGGADGNGGVVTTNDISTLIATGDYNGAGIGGGSDGNGGTLTTNDTSTITSEGEDGAGIGGGRDGAGGSVTINDGAVVTATGDRAIGPGAAAAGGAWGSLSNAGILTIPTGSTLPLTSTATVTNTGTIINNGAINGTGTIANTNNGTIAGTGTIADDGQAAEGDGLHITANSYVVSYDENRDDPDTHPDTVVLAPTLTAAGTTLPTPDARTGAAFTGWHTAAAGGTRVTDGTDLGDALTGPGPVAATLYAQYTIGQTVTFTTPAPVGVTLGDTYTPAATGGASGQPVVLSIDPSTTNNSCTITAGTVTFAHTGSCVVAADQAGSGTYTAALRLTQSIPISPAATTTTLTVTAGSLTATVAPATATGTVTFAVGGTSVGTAPLVDGVATLTYTVPTAKARTVSATYPGNADHTGSSDSASRANPTITATVVGKHNRAGWYDRPVTIRFWCTTTSAPLTKPCPDPVALRHNGAGQSRTRTVHATDGGTDTTTVRGIHIDKSAPKVRVRGVKKGRTYTGTAPKPRCMGTDRLSGIASCTITKRIRKTATGTKVRYTATATDKAGNRTRKRGAYRTRTTYLAGVPVRHGHFQVALGDSYQLVVASRSRPAYYLAELAPRRPHIPGPALHHIGPNRWAITVTIDPGMRTGGHWNIGIKTGTKLRILPLNVHS